MKPTPRRRRRALIALLTALTGVGLGSLLIAGSASALAPSGQNAPCIPIGGYPDTPDTRKVSSLSDQDKANLKKDLLEAIIRQETNGKPTESAMATSSGVKASYKSLVQTTAPTAIDALLRMSPSQLASFKPDVGDKQPLTQKQVQGAKTVSDAAVFLWKGMRDLEWANEKAQAAAIKAGTKVPANITAADVLKGTFNGHNNETSRTTAGLTVDDVTTMMNFYGNWKPTDKYKKPPLEDGVAWARAAIQRNPATQATAAKIQDLVTKPEADGRVGLALGRVVVDNEFDDALKKIDPKTTTVDDFVKLVAAKHNGSRTTDGYAKAVLGFYHQKMQARQNNATKTCPKSKAPSAKPKPASPVKPQPVKPQPAKPQPAAPAKPAPTTQKPSPSPTTLPSGDGSKPCLIGVESCPPIPPVQLPDLPSQQAPVVPAPAGPPGGVIPGFPSTPDLPDPVPPPADGAGTPCFPEIEQCPGYSDDPQFVDPGPDTGSDPGSGGYLGGGGGGGGCDYDFYSDCYLEEDVL